MRYSTMLRPPPPAQPSRNSGIRFIGTLAALTLLAAQTRQCPAANLWLAQGYLGVAVADLPDAPDALVANCREILPDRNTTPEAIQAAASNAQLPMQVPVQNLAALAYPAQLSPEAQAPAAFRARTPTPEVRWV